MIITIGDILDLAEVRRAQELISGAEFLDGRRTAGYRAKNVKNNEQLAAGDHELKKMVKTALQRHPEFKRAALPKKVRPPVISRYGPGMAYGSHVDDAIMGDGDCRTDLSVTVFLNDPSAYDGGELQIESPFGGQEIKLPAGAAVVYPSSCLHRVCPVATGERLAAVTWVQSLVRDPQKREILYDLDHIRTHLHRTDKASATTDLAFKSYSNLMRLWSEP